MTFFIDALSLTLLLLIGGLLAVVLRFAHVALDGDPRRRPFMVWLGLTGAAVLALVISGNLLQFAIAWSATSLGLHRLLVFYPERPGALLAARKKFVISRLGDACLVAVLILTWREFGTWDFRALFVAAPIAAARSGGPSAQLQAIGLLLAAGAMLKSAQFPFHSWLPDTMETPTPVSALMHAGIINAGGFLVIRMNSLVALSPWALGLLATVGAFTALFAALVMLTHSSVKRGLAFSTVAQMGFMMFECGLGAFDLAVLHLVAHSLYKAHAFLSSGGVVGAARGRTPNGAVPTTAAIAGLATATAAITAAARFLHLPLAASAGAFILASIFTCALATFVARLWTSWSWRRALVGASAAFGLAVTYMLLHRLFGAIVGSVPRAPLGTAGRIATVTLLAGGFVLNMVAPGLVDRPFARALYVHARNGFYLNTLANRLVTGLWPVRTSHTESH